MRQFSLGGAWSKGIEFISRHAVNHAIILIGMGIILPMILQYAVSGSVTGVNPMMMGQNAMGAGGSMAALAGTMLLVLFLSYVLQMGSYFSSWRIGLGREESLGGAIIYGIICAVLAIIAFVLIVLVVTLVAGLAMQGGGAMAFLALLAAIPILILAAALYSVMMAAMAMAMFLVLLIVLAFGASMGAGNPALAAMVGQGGIAVLIALLVVALLFWLAARFSCTTSVMADRKSFNLFAGLAQSWRLTGPNQFRIMAYLAVLGIVLCVVLLVFFMVLGAAMMGSLSSGQVPDIGIGSLIMMLLAGIFFAYVTVLVPAGIYRELFEEAEVAEVFA